eukprot:TRINITY_DN5800_c0_g1_i4.p2 TRINITY_DN5800_c0_g1~~TRINITY_DN5800_c0_g1_i4.p2  ORF type:complete len:105 (-),score=6.27 TRINITY_DN5800_c0_g1_i4:298-612(-)
MCIRDSLTSCAIAKQRARAAAIGHLGHTQISSQVFLLVSQELSLHVGCEGEEVRCFWKSQPRLNRKKFKHGVRGGVRVVEEGGFERRLNGEVALDVSGRGTCSS